MVLLTDCHPVGPGDVASGRKFPGGFKGHQIVLSKHDVLGKDGAACLACHADPSTNPGKLVLIDGTLVDIKGDVAGVCFRCHSAKYNEWKAGTHGKAEAKCTAQGCHDPHSPSYIYAPPLLPFVGSGFQIRAVSDREGFKPLAGPPVQPPVVTPMPMVVAAVLAVLVSIGLIGFLIAGRSKS